MKTSHLAAIALAGLGAGGMSSAGMPGSAMAEIQPVKQALPPHNSNVIHVPFSMEKGGYPITSHPCSWRKKNQRQARLARRRSHAAGKRNAFA